MKSLTERILNEIFTDNAGRSWTIAINVNVIKRVRDLLDVDLASTADGDEKSKKLLAQLMVDPILLCDVVYCVCKPEADKLGITDEDFGRAMADLAQAQDMIAESQQYATLAESVRSTINNRLWSDADSAYYRYLKSDATTAPPETRGNGRAIQLNVPEPENRASVLDVPLKNRPVNFTGLVGKYKISASATPTEVRVGDPITLTVRVSGPDYLGNIDLPSLARQPNLARAMGARIGLKNVALDSFIVSATPYEDLRLKYENGSWDRKRFAEAHILFPEQNRDYDYLAAIMKRGTSEKLQ